jgi:hypothetical protein
MQIDLRELVKLHDKAAQWATSASKSSTPLEEATNAVEKVMSTLDALHVILPSDWLEFMQIFLSAMHTSAGVEYPDVIAHRETPMQDDIDRSQDNLFFTLQEGNGILRLLHYTQCAIDVFMKWFSLYYCSKDDSDDEDADDE